FQLAVIMASFIIHKPRQWSPSTRATLNRVMAFIKACKEQIDLLKNSITNEEANTKGWHGIKGSDASNADVIAHKHGVIDLINLFVLAL
ncbi:hypothetical protein Tsubulata_045538, partial [Turnera subulata]